MRAIVFLADFAQQDPVNKVHAIGIGWSVTQTPTPPQAVVALVHVPWTQTNEQLGFQLALTDGDGRPVEVDAGAGVQPIMIEGGFEIGRPAGIPHGTEIELPIVVNIPAGLPLQPGSRYVWRLYVDGETQSDWFASFYVQPHVPQGTGPAAIPDFG